MGDKGRYLVNLYDEQSPSGFSSFIKQIDVSSVLGEYFGGLIGKEQAHREIGGAIVRAFLSNEMEIRKADWV